MHYAITFVFCTCAAGAAHVGVITTKGMSQESYAAGFKLFHDSIENSFANQSHLNIFITDDAFGEINALKEIWPESKTFLCIFHVCQAVWRWLWDKNNEIEKIDEKMTEQASCLAFRKCSIPLHTKRHWIHIQIFASPLRNTQV